MNRCLPLLLLLAVPAAADTAGDLCEATRSTVAISEIAVAGEEGVQSRGTWQVEGGAAGVLLEYRTDNDRIRMESMAGMAGTWSFTEEKVMGGCGRHTLRVYAFPYVERDGRQVYCMKQVSSTPQSFEISCAPVAEIGDCQWECAAGPEGRCTGTCTASARRGRLAYQPHWEISGAKATASEPAPESASEGPWTRAVTCAPGEKVTFKVRDRDGRGLWSNVAERACGK